jgi:hypothetical protein
MYSIWVEKCPPPLPVCVGRGTVAYVQSIGFRTVRDSLVETFRHWICFHASLRLFVRGVGLWLGVQRRFASCFWCFDFKWISIFRSPATYLQGRRKLSEQSTVRRWYYYIYIFIMKHFSAFRVWYLVSCSRGSFVHVVGFNYFSAFLYACARA